MSIDAIDIRAELAGRPVLHARTKDTPDAEARAAFAVLAPFRDGSIFAGSFSGESKWERHGQGDELVHVLDGAATLTIVTADGPRSLELRRGHARGRPPGPLASVRGPRPGHRAHRHAAAHRAHRRGPRVGGRPRSRRRARGDRDVGAAMISGDMRSGDRGPKWGTT